MDIQEKLTLNAYLERLIDSGGTDGEARTAVAEFGRTLKGASRLELEGSVTKPGGTISGQTNEHGSVQMNDDKASTSEISRGTGKQRVGYYKIWRQKDRRNDWILISHFWKSDTGTQSDAEVSQQWALALDGDGQPQWFAERAFREMFTWRITKSAAIELKREIYPDLWTTGAKGEHLGGVAVHIIVGRE